MRDVPAGPDNFVLAPAWGDPPHYRLYIDSGRDRATRLAAEFDCRLSEQNVEYASKRQTHRLGAIELAPLPAGTLARLDDRYRAKAAGRSEQFKHRFLLPECDLDADLRAAAEPRVPAVASPTTPASSALPTE